MLDTVDHGPWGGGGETAGGGVGPAGQKRKVEDHFVAGSSSSTAWEEQQAAAGPEAAAAAVPELDEQRYQILQSVVAVLKENGGQTLMDRVSMLGLGATYHLSLI